MWKGEYDGKVVAAKILRAYTESTSEQVRKVGGPWIIAHIKKPIMLRVAVMQGDRDMEATSSSKYPAVAGRRY